MSDKQSSETRLRSEATAQSGSSQKMLKVTLVRSTLGFEKDQKAAAKQLRLTKLHRSAVWPDTPSVRGQIRKIEHLVEVEEA